MLKKGAVNSYGCLHLVCCIFLAAFSATKELVFSLTSIKRKKLNLFLLSSVEHLAKNVSELYLILAAGVISLFSDRGDERESDAALLPNLPEQ